MASKNTTVDRDSLRFADAADETRRRLAPIRGYENLKLVSLEEATDPLVPIVRDIKHMVHNALADSEQIDSPLPLDQRASIFLYSMQWTSYESSLYHILNNTLRSPNRDRNLPPWLPFLKLFLTALAELPTSEKQIVYRGVNFDSREHYPLHSSRIWWGFSSCTCSIASLGAYGTFGRSGPTTIFVIETDTAKRIDQFSPFPQEEEFLLLPGRELKVIGHLSMGDGVTMIQMKEVQSLYPNIIFPPVPSSSRRLEPG